MNGELDARYRDVSLKDAVRRVSMDMTLDGWVYIGVVRQYQSLKQKTQLSLGSLFFELGAP